MDAKEKSSCRYFILLILLYIVTRLPILFSYFETVPLELYRGTLAKEWMAGFNLPWGDYIPEPHALAPIFNGLLTVPFFKLFGETMFALKFLPFCWHLLSLVALFFVWRSFFDDRQVFFILLLFILAPPTIVSYTLTNHGTHFELILWTAFSLLILKRLFDGKISWMQAGLFLGFLGGISSSFILTNLVTVFVVLFYVFLAQNKKKFYLFYTIGCLVGFAPMLFYNAHHGWTALDLPKEMFFYKITPGILLSHIQSVFLQGDTGLRGLFSFNALGNYLNKIFTAIYMGIYLFSLLYLFVGKWGFWKHLKNRFDIEVFALIYQILLFGLVVGLRFGQWDCHLFPLVPFMGMTIVWAAQRVKPILKWGMLGFCVLAGLIGNFILIDFRGMGKTLSMPGFSYGDLGEVLESNFGPNVELFQQKAKKALQDRPLSAKKEFYQGVTFRFKENL